MASAHQHPFFVAPSINGVLWAGSFFVGTGAHDANDRIIYNPVKGFLIYDSNGNQAGGAHIFATVSANLDLTHADFMVIA